MRSKYRDTMYKLMWNSWILGSKMVRKYGVFNTQLLMMQHEFVHWKFMNDIHSRMQLTLQITLLLNSHSESILFVLITSMSFKPNSTGTWKTWAYDTYIKPRTLRLNGKVERSHGTDQREFYQLLTYKNDVDLHAKLVQCLLNGYASRVWPVIAS